MSQVALLSFRVRTNILEGSELSRQNHLWPQPWIPGRRREGARGPGRQERGLEQERGPSGGMGGLSNQDGRMAISTLACARSTATLWGFLRLFSPGMSFTLVDVKSLHAQVPRLPEPLPLAVYSPLPSNIISQQCLQLTCLICAPGSPLYLLLPQPPPSQMMAAPSF